MSRSISVTRGALCGWALMVGVSGCRCPNHPPIPTDRVIAEVPFARGGGSHAIVTQGHVNLCGGLPEGCNPNLRVVFPTLTNASAGSTVWVNSATAHFDNLVSLITNGVSDPFSVMFEAGGGEGWAGFEPGFFTTQLQPGHVDLAGHAVHRIGYRVDAISFVSPGSDGAHDGVWTDAKVQGAFLFEGTP